MDLLKKYGTKLDLVHHHQKILPDGETQRSIARKCFKDGPMTLTIMKMSAKKDGIKIAGGFSTQTIFNENSNDKFTPRGDEENFIFDPCKPSNYVSKIMKRLEIKMKTAKAPQLIPGGVKRQTMKSVEIRRPNQAIRSAKGDINESINDP